MQRTSPGPWMRRRGLVASCKLRKLHIMVLIATAMVLTPLLLTRRDVDHEVHVVTLENPLPRDNPVPTTATELIAALAAATRRAAAAGATLSHPSCASRHEMYTLYYNRSISDLAPNSKWAAVLREYGALHRACVSRMGDDVEQFFLGRRRVDGCRFVVAGVSAGSGVGNKALSVVSALVYAVITQRVLLVPGAFGAAFCEPFEGSSWMVDPELRWTQSKKRRDLWAKVDVFNAKVDGGIRDPIYAVSTTEDWDAQPTPRFFCDTEQAHYADVDWINFRNNLYFVPKLFAVGSFTPLLEDIFPDRNVLTHVLRTAFLPCDAVWARVRRVRDEAHIWRGSVGVQERYFDGTRGLHAAMEDHVRDCLSEYIRPHPSSTIFLTSLYKHRLQSPLHVVQLSHEETQRFGVDVDMQAVTEILCLSLTDHLIVTPLSTLGALAQGYGALVPWFIDLRPETTTPCVRALSHEACYQLPATKLLTCPHDVSVNGRVMTDVVPYLVDCHLVETPYLNPAALGLQLITDQTM